MKNVKRRIRELRMDVEWHFFFVPSRAMWW